MNILFFASADSIHSHKWINFFHKKGHNVFWLSLTPSITKTPVKYIHCKNLFSLWWNARQILKTQNIDITHVHYLGTHSIIPAALAPKNLIYTAWGSDILLNRKVFFKRIFLDWILPKAVVITSDAHHLFRALDEFQVPKEKQKLILFGIDTNDFLPSSKNEKSSHPVIISTRNLEPIYNVETLIRAIPIVLKAFPHALFRVGGRGAEKQKLLDLCAELKIEKNVTFLGFKPNDELKRIIQNSDIYVSTSLSDAGIAASTAEAMACEIPAVISQSGENDLWITHNENGKLFPVKDFSQLAEEIIDLLNSPDLHQKIAKNGRKTIVEKNDYTTEMNKMNDIYNEVLNSHK